MPISVVGVASGLGSNTPATHASTVSGDLLVVFVSTRNGGGTPGITPPAGDGWTQGGTVLGAGSSAEDYTLFRWYYKEAAASGALDLGTWKGFTGGDTVGSNGLSWVCLTVRGHRALSSGLTFPSTNTTSDSADTVSETRTVEAASVTPNTLNALAVTAFATRITDYVGGSETWATTTGGWTDQTSIFDTGSMSIGVATKALGASLAATGTVQSLFDSNPPAGSTYKVEAGLSLIIRPANSAPPTPGVFTAPVSGSVFNTTHTVTHGASVDPEGDTVTYRIEASTNNGASWDHVLATARTGVTGTIDFTSIPSSSSAKLRVRASDGVATSAWRESDVFTIAHNTAPTAATLLSPVGGSTADRTAVDLRWDFTDPDAGDTQSKADVRYRVVGAGSWTTVANAATTNENYLLGTVAAGDYEWQVKTYDAASIEGVWSSSGFFTAADVPSPPTITSHAVDDTIATSTDSLAWSGTGTSVEVRKVADDGAGNPNTASVYYASGTVTPGTLDHPLDFPVNNRTEHLQVRRLVGGLWSDWASVRIVVDYTPPEAPVAVVTVHQVDGRDAALRITITNP